MAQQFDTTMLNSVVAAALNRDHAQVILSAGSPYVHYDGTEWSKTNVEQVISTAAPAGFTEAVPALLGAAAFLNTHFTYADVTSGDKVYAHKTADGSNTISGTMSSAATYAASMRALCVTLCNDLAVKYEGHRSNSGGSYHANADSLNYFSLPALDSNSTDQQIAERITVLRSLLGDHVIQTSVTAGTCHASADTGNVPSAALPSYSSISGMDWDKAIAAVNELRTKLNSHVGQSTSVHGGGADTTNVVTAAVAAYPAGLFSLVNEIVTKYELHRASTSFHGTADSTYTLSVSTVSTITALVTATGLIVVAIMGHCRNAPTSRAWRQVA